MGPCFSPGNQAFSSFYRFSVDLARGGYRLQQEAETVRFEAE
jgi:hypothetical protein